jgi:Spy/CpxP family protein refolding chaperone
LTIGLGPHFRHPPSEPGPPGAAQIGRNWMAHLTERLNLTADQQTKIEPILADAAAKIQALHRTEVEQGSQIFKSANSQISALLTPAQQVELQKMETEREKMFMGHMRHHEGPGDGKPPPPPGAQTNAPPPAPGPPPPPQKP